MFLQISARLLQDAKYEGRFEGRLEGIQADRAEAIIELPNRSRKSIPAQKPMTAGRKYKTPMGSDCSIAGIKRPRSL